MKNNGVKYEIFTHITCRLSSNGEAERFVISPKKYSNLLLQHHLWSTPHSTTHKTPSKLLIVDCELHTQLDLLKNKSVCKNQVLAQQSHKKINNTINMRELRSWKLTHNCNMYPHQDLCSEYWWRVMSLVWPAS